MGPDLTKQFSLDYLIGGNRTNERVREAVSEDTSNNMVDVLSQPILREIQKAPGGRIKVFELVDRLAEIYGDIRPEALAPIVKRLTASKRLQVVEQDRHGNDTLQLM